MVVEPEKQHSPASRGGRGLIEDSAALKPEERPIIGQRDDGSEQVNGSKPTFERCCLALVLYTRRLGFRSVCLPRPESDHCLL